MVEISAKQPKMKCNPLKQTMTKSAYTKLWSIILHIQQSIIVILGAGCDAGTEIADDNNILLFQFGFHQFYSVSFSFVS